MWLILGGEFDRELEVAAGALRARGLEPLEVVRSDALGAGFRLEHRFGSDHNDLRLGLPDGRVIDGGEVRGTLNRLSALPTAQFASLDRGDQLYAVREAYAATWGWIAGLTGPVLNPPTTFGLCSERRGDPQWAVLGARAGLATRPWRLRESVAEWEPESLVWVVGARVLADQPVVHLADACLRLARAADMPLLRLDFDENGALGPVTPLPSLSEGGEMLFDALAEALAA